MTTTRLVLAIFALGVACSTKGFANPPLTIEANHDEAVRPYSAVPVEIVFTNHGNNNITLANFPIPRLVRIEMQTEEEELLYRGVIQVPRAVADYFIPPQALEPGAKLSFRSKITCAWQDATLLGSPLFDKPGNYKIRFSYPVTVENNGAEESSWLVTPFSEIAVESVDERHEAALDAVGELSQPGLLLEAQELQYQFEERNQQEQWEKELETLLSNHAASPWAAYAYFAQAEMHIHWHHEARIAEARSKHEADPADLRRAAELLEKAAETAEEYDIPHVQQDALKRWQSVLHELGEGDSEQADEIRRRIKDITDNQD